MFTDSLICFGIARKRSHGKDGSGRGTIELAVNKRVSIDASLNRSTRSTKGLTKKSITFALQTPAIARKADVGALGPNPNPMPLPRLSTSLALGDYAAALLARIRNCHYPAATRFSALSFARTTEFEELRRCILATSLICQASIPQSTSPSPSQLPPTQHSQPSLPYGTTLHSVKGIAHIV
jgi:hypothetical protein